MGTGGAAKEGGKSNHVGEVLTYHCFATIIHM